MLTDIIMLAYNLTDAYWLSRYSTYALAAPRQAWPIFLVFVSILIGITNANLAILSQYVGAKLYNKVSETTSKLFTLCLFISFLLFIVYEIMRYNIFVYLMKVPTEMLQDVLGYTKVIALDIIGFGVSAALSTIVQSFGDVRTPAIVMGIGALLNAVLDPLFIVGLGIIPPMGAEGAAIATVITRLFSGLLLFSLIGKRYPETRIRLVYSIDEEWITLSFKVGVPVIIMTISDGLAFTFQQALVNTFGAIAATAFTIGFMVMDIANSVFRGFTMSISIMVGQCLGAGDAKRARRVALTAAHTLMAVIFMGATLVFFARNHLISIFTTDPMVSTETERLITIISWVLPLMMLSFLGMSVGRGSGHTVVPTVVNIMRFWVIRIGVGWLLSVALGMGVTGIWIAIALSELLGGTISYAWIRKGGWTKPVIKH
ncbi:MAG: MATE family efflux transporter [Ignisphaera sp.]